MKINKDLVQRITAASTVYSVKPDVNLHLCLLQYMSAPAGHAAIERHKTFTESEEKVGLSIPLTSKPPNLITTNSTY